MSTDTRLPVALALAVGGLRVFPWSVSNGAKVPLTSRGHNDASTDPDRISGWWDAYPDAQIGVVFGDLPLCAIDLDCHPGKPNGFDTLLDEKLDLPQTLHVTTPSGGKHYYYRTTEALSRRTHIRPGIDLLAGSNGWAGFYGDLEAAERLTSEELPLLPEWATSTPDRPATATAPVDTTAFYAITRDPKDPYAPAFEPLVVEAATAGNTAMASLVMKWAVLAEAHYPGSETALRALQAAWLGRSHGTGDPDAEFNHMVKSAMSKAVALREQHDKEILSLLDDEDEEPAPDEVAPASPSAVLSKFPLLDLARLVGPDKPERRWLLEGLIPEGDSTSLIASAGIGKSLFLFALSIRIAFGDTHFIGQKINVRDDFKILYVDMENSEVDLSERLVSLGVTPENVGQLTDRFLPLSLPPLNPLDTDKGAAELFSVMDAYGLLAGDVLVLDSLQRITEGDENSNDTMRALYRRIYPQLKARGITVIRTDNVGHEGTRARGASAKRDDVAASWVMKDEGSGVFSLLPSKMRALAASHPFTFKRTHDNGTTKFERATKPVTSGFQFDVWYEKIGAPGVNKTWEQIKHERVANPGFMPGVTHKRMKDLITNYTPTVDDDIFIFMDETPAATASTLDETEVA